MRQAQPTARELRELHKIGINVPDCASAVIYDGQRYAWHRPLPGATLGVKSHKRKGSVNWAIRRVLRHADAEMLAGPFSDTAEVFRQINL